MPEIADVRPFDCLDIGSVRSDEGTDDQEPQGGEQATETGPDDETMTPSSVRFPNRPGAARVGCMEGAKRKMKDEG